VQSLHCGGVDAAASLRHDVGGASSRERPPSLDTEYFVPSSEGTTLLTLTGFRVVPSARRSFSRQIRIREHDNETDARDFQLSKISFDVERQCRSVLISPPLAVGECRATQE
jgi:hypothetical protein